MKKIVEIDTKEGLESLLGQKVLLLCANYFYTGRLVGVNRTCVLLDEAAIVYETGRWDAPEFVDSQSVGRPLYVRTSAIEAFMPRGRK
jgi:hypothetical protein